MDVIIKMYVLGKIKEFARKRILEEEIIKGAKKGLEKLESVMKNFWENAENFIKKSKEIDNRYIPDVLEVVTEEISLEIIENFKKDINIRNLIEEILKEEKKEIGI